MNETAKALLAPYKDKIRIAYFFEGVREHFRPTNGQVLVQFDSRVAGLDAPEVGEDWLVFNAPRPLYGSINTNGRGTTWQGEFHSGVFYSAVDPEDFDAALWTQKNVEQDAAICIWVTREEVESGVRAYYAERFPDTDIDYDSFGYSDFVRSYRNTLPDRWEG